MQRPIAAASSLAILFVMIGPVSAQHHHGGHHGTSHTPVHHGSRYGHKDWSHVVPHRSNHVGAYYTHGDTHYYTPSRLTHTASIAAVPHGQIEVHRPVALTFGGYGRYEDLAGRLEFEANLMCVEMHYNYRHNENYAEVYREAYSILQAAKYLHAKEHMGDRQVIHRRMVEVDRLFHHVQEELSGWSRVPHRPVGAGTLREKVEGVEAVLHHLCYDVGVKPHEETPEDAPPPSEGEIAPPPRNVPPRNPPPPADGNPFPAE